RGGTRQTGNDRRRADAEHERVSSIHDEPPDWLERPPLFESVPAQLRHARAELTTSAAIRQPWVKPTRLVNGFATASLPSTILSGNAGKGRGAGPSSTSPPSRGL